MNDKDLRFSVTAEDRFSRTFATLKRDMSGVTQGLGQFAAVGRAAGAALGVLSFGAVAGVGGLGLALKRLTEDIDALNDSSDAIGDTVENISALEDVARRNGASLDVVTSSVFRLNKTLAEAKADSPAAQALRNIGLSVRELRDLAPTEALRSVSVALAAFENDRNKSESLRALFGNSSREFAGFLNDLAEAGELNAKVTTKQAEEAARFNKTLAAFSAEAGTAGRAIASELLPYGTRLLQLFKDLRENGADRVLVRELGVATVIQSQRLRFLVSRIEDLNIALEKDPGNTGIQKALVRLRGEYDELSRSAAKYNDMLKLQFDNSTGRGRRPANEGGGGLASRRLRQLEEDQNAATRVQVSGAQRYLEQLQRQQDQLQQMTATQQLLRDIERGRIEGLTPALEKRLRTEAATVDAMREQTDALRAQQQALDDLIASRTRRADELDSILNATPTGQGRAIERRVDLVLSFARANPDNEAIQRQALEAVKMLRGEFDRLEETARNVGDAAKDPFVRIDEFARKTTDALVEMAATGDFSAKGLFESFRRDLLREFMEDPVRDAMRNVVDIIKTEAAKLGAESGGPLAALFRLLGSSGGGGGSSAFDIFSIFRGPQSRALGGPAEPDRLYRWRENGAEYFVPQERGTVITQADLRSMGGAYSPSYSFTIQGGDPQLTAQAVRRMLDDREANLLRRMRYGSLRSA